MRSTIRFSSLSSSSSSASASLGPLLLLALAPVALAACGGDDGDGGGPAASAGSAGRAGGAGTSAGGTNAKGGASGKAGSAGTASASGTGGTGGSGGSAGTGGSVAGGAGGAAGAGATGGVGGANGGTGGVSGQAGTGAGGGSAGKGGSAGGGGTGGGGKAQGGSAGTGVGGQPSAGSGGTGAGGKAGSAGQSSGGAGGGTAGTGGTTSTPPVGTCGDGKCEGTKGEACGTCVADCGACATGTSYYVSATDGDDDKDGKTPATAWKTLSKVQAAGKGNTNKRILQPGDNVLFKRGDHFVGTLLWDNFYVGSGDATVHGTEGKPLTFASYGTGPKPVFEYPPDTTVKEAEDRRQLQFYGLDYLIIDGLAFTDPKFDPTDKLTPALLGVPIQIGVYNEVFAKHCVIQNVDIWNVGMGVVVTGEFNVVDHCSFVDLKNLVDTKCANPNDTGKCSYEDYGANGVTLSGNDNVVSNNFFSGNYAHSYDFEFNGGAIEAYGGKIGLNRNQILFNTVFDSDGVMEFGSAGEATSKDNLLAYNLFIDNGSLSYASLEGVFATQVSNVMYFNNTVVETPKSRYAKDKSPMLSAGGKVTADVLFDATNNVFYLQSNDTVYRANVDAAKYLHHNNLFHFENGGAAPFTPEGSEKVVPGAVFVDTTNADPTKWDYHLLPGSVGLGAGKDVGLHRDHDGATVGATPDIGAFESN